MDAVLADLQQPTSVDVRVSYNRESRTLRFSEGDDWRSASYELCPNERGSRRVVRLADWMQEQFFPETFGAWGEARPACPGHPAPSRADSGWRRGTLGLSARRSCHRSDRTTGAVSVADTACRSFRELRQWLALSLAEQTFTLVVPLYRLAGITSSSVILSDATRSGASGKPLGPKVRSDAGQQRGPTD